MRSEIGQTKGISGFGFLLVLNRLGLGEVKSDIGLNDFGFDKG